MFWQHFILFLLWLLYGVIHSVLAASRVKAALIKLMRISPRVYRLSYNLIAFAGLILILVYQFTLKTQLLFDISVGIVIVSFVLMVPGMLIMIRSVIKYFKQLSGLKKLDPVLETGGMHGYVRHPLYAGTFLFITGLFFLMPTLANLICIIVIIVYTLFAIRFEEKKLLKIFGDEYRSYQDKVPMILPFLRR
jgi:methanethiol S-methyltransferase